MTFDEIFDLTAGVYLYFNNTRQSSQVSMSVTRDGPCANVHAYPSVENPRICQSMSLDATFSGSDRWQRRH